MQSAGSICDATMRESFSLEMPGPVQMEVLPLLQTGHKAQTLLFGVLETVDHVAGEFQRRNGAEDPELL